MGNWIVVASADHVARGVAGGFVQACHGQTCNPKAAPLDRMRPGDGVICYSSVTTFGGREALQAFTAMGIVADDPVCVAEAGGMRPHRRDIIWTVTGAAPIRPLLDKLELTAGQRNWGAPLRHGVLPISARDTALIGVALRLAAARSTAAETPRRAA